MGEMRRFPEGKVHYKWDNSLQPVVTVGSGETVEFITQEVTDGQVTRRSTAEALGKLDLDRIYPLAGPLGIEGAEPGDTLQVDVLELEPLEWGWTGIIPGLGLLPEFKEPYLKIWDLSGGERTELKPGIEIPLDPFCGTMGVAPAEPGSIFIMPPGPFGGNMDIRHLNAGSTLFLPVQVPGALFSVGDCHAAQGDGEVCVTGIECPMRSRLRFRLHKGHRIPGPQFETPGPLTSRWDSKGYFATTGIGPDLLEDAREAIRRMIDHLVRTYDLSPEDAYVLCSVAVDLKISEIVDQPNWIVSAYLPKSVLPRAG